VNARRLSTVGALVGVAAAIVVIAVLVSSGGGDGTPKRSTRDVTAVIHGVPQKGLLLGDPGAKVLLVEFADPQCPFCRQFSKETWPTIVKRYVRPGKVRMELRLVGFLGPDSVRGDRALLAAALQDKLWEATARFYAQQGQENSGYVTDAFLRSVLGGVRGLDVGRAMAARDSPQVDAEIGAVGSMQSLYGVNATPTLLIGTDDTNLKKVSEQVASPEQLGAILDAELAKRAS
jgi:protein-disulfide isomerase